MSYQYYCVRCGQTYDYADYLENKFCRTCGTFLMRAKPPRGEKYWIFQTNPNTFRVFDWWKDHPHDTSITWSIRQYDDQVRKRDQGIIWLSGLHSGAYATVKVATNPAKIDYTEEEKSYWTDKKELYKLTKRSILEYQSKFIDRYLSRKFCLDDAILSGLSILKQAQGTVFKLTEKQFKKIEETVFNIR